MYKKLGAYIFILFLWSCASKMPTSYAYATPQQTKAEVGLSVIETGYTCANEVFIHEKGSLFSTHRSNNIAVYVKHPKGDFLFDTGFGSDYQDQLDNMAWPSCVINNHNHTKIAGDEIDTFGEKSDIRFILLSHMHWDHVSGINDFPDAEVWTTKAEYDFAFSDEAKKPAFMQSDFNDPNINWHFIEFTDGAYENFDASLDLYADGTIVLVPLPGHTPGSVGMFVNLASGTRYFFIGDLSFSEEAVHKNAEKNFFARGVVDHKHKVVRKELNRVHFLSKEKPELIVVPSHDGSVSLNIKQYPEFEY